MKEKTFIDELEKKLNITTTANGGVAYKSTLNKNLDLFGSNLRNIYQNQIEETTSKMKDAAKEDVKIFAKNLLNELSIREGNGNRMAFKIGFKILINEDEELAEKVLLSIPELGRWDYVLTNSIGTKFEEKAIEMIRKQLEKDVENATAGKEISLLAKWLPSINAGKKAKVDAKILINKLGISEQTYRKKLSFLRSKIYLVETSFSQKKKIEFEKIPSIALNKYKNKLEKEGLVEFLEKNKDAKLNASVNTPGKIVEQILSGKQGAYDKVFEKQWEGLKRDNMPKDFVPLSVVDVSGSMYGTPITNSIGLGIYLSELIKDGPFKDAFLTFSETPSLVKIKRDGIAEKVRDLKQIDWGYNTNLEKVFSVILDATKKADGKGMPTHLFIFSDMEFDEAILSIYDKDKMEEEKQTIFERSKKMFEEANFELPKVIFWNLEAESNKPVLADTTGTILVGGVSVNLFENIFRLDKEVQTPVEFMLKTLSKYDEYLK